MKLKQFRNWEGLPLALSVGMILLWIIPHYELNWIQTEHSYYMIPRVLWDGYGFGWVDFKTAMDSFGFDHLPRARFLSYAATIGIVKTRTFLFGYFNPHPTLSPMWLLTYGIAPYYFWKFLKSAFNPTVALTGLALLLLSPGYLSLSTMLLHPAKGLVFAAFAFTLWKAYVISRTGAMGGYLGLLGVIGLSLFADETAAVLFLTTGIVLFPRFLYLPTRKKLGVLALHFSPVLIFLLIVLFVVPPLFHAFGYERFSYFSYALSNTHKGQIHFFDFFRHLGVLFGSHLLPMKTLVDQGWKAERFSVIVFVIFSLLSFIAAVRHNTNLRLRQLGLAFCLMGVVLLVHWVISARHNVILSETRSCYYYGSLFSAVWSILLAVVLSWTRPPLRIAITLAVSIFYLLNFDAMTRHWHKIHVGMFQGAYPLESKDLNSVGSRPLTYALTRELWSDCKYKGWESVRLRARDLDLPIQALWLHGECSAYWNRYSTNPVVEDRAFGKNRRNK